MPDDLVETLQRRDSPTALYLRGRADRVAVHRQWHVEFEWEAKTHLSSTRLDMVLEALPLAHHIEKAKLKVKCLYVYFNPINNFQAGFWCDAIPPIARIFLPERWRGEQRMFFKEVFAEYFPNTELVEPKRPMGGSGDPFVVIAAEDVKKLPDWKILVVEYASGGK